jgi:transcription initiation factor TFIIIB Brf1 subunit/transcription initiation factor TFIIB
MSCKHKDTITDDVTGEVMCKNCGRVIEKIESTNIEYKDRPEASLDPSKSYVLGTWIGGNKAERKKVTDLVEETDYNLVSANKHIKNYCNMITSNKHIPIRALEIFKKIRRKKRRKSNALVKASEKQKKVAPKRHIKPLAVACVLYACRENKIPVTITTLATISHIPKKRFTSYYNEISEILNIPLPLDKAKDKVSQIASKIRLPEKTARKAVKLLDSISSKNTGSNPFGIAAAALYICQSSEHPVTLRSLALASDLSEPTIGNSVKRIKKILKKK